MGLVQWPVLPRGLVSKHGPGGQLTGQGRLGHHDGSGPGGSILPPGPSCEESELLAGNNQKEIMQKDLIRPSLFHYADGILRASFGGSSDL